MGMDLTRREIEAALENPANQPRLPASHVERFNAAQLATVLENEIIKAAAAGLSHIAVNMNLVDCAALARALRGAAKKGH
jgi:hypothetical protein